MTTQNANPFINPANNDSLAGVFRQILDYSFKNFKVMLPAKIIAFNRSAIPNTAQVQLQISVVGTDGTVISQAPIAKIPVLQIGGGGFFLSFDLKPGDIGWLIAADRDISLFLQSLSESKPATMIIHDFSAGMFLPHFMGDQNVAVEDQSNAIFQNSTGTVKISLGVDKITLTAPIVEINGDLELNGDLSVSGESQVQEREIVYGDIASGGNITAVGNITPDTPIPPLMVTIWP